MELKINKVLYEVTDAGELNVRLAQIGRTQFSEVWMQHEAGWPAMGALINGEAAWLMHVRYEGDAGFSTRNPLYAGPEKASLNITCRTASAMSTRPLGTSPPPKQFAAFSISLKKRPWRPGCTGTKSVRKSVGRLPAWPSASGRGIPSYTCEQLGSRIHSLSH